VTFVSAAAVIVSAGRGERFGSPKHRALLGGKPVLEWSLEAFQGCREVAALVLVLQDPVEGAELRRRYPKLRAVVAGGAQRQHSVHCGFRALTGSEPGLVLIHDGARPLVSRELIRRVLEGAEREGAAVPVIPVEDSLKKVTQGFIRASLDRSELFRSQTPQAFRYALLKQGLEEAERDGYIGTDEAALLERLGRKVAAVPGDWRNLKLTTPEDLEIAEAYLE
jgi:2-C-methyl-D-erythritol 4-phosphate cytidylyltransferase